MTIEEGREAHANVCKQLGVDEVAPELDRRTEQWLGLFRLCSGQRSYSEVGAMPIKPLDILAISDRLQFPGEDEEILSVIQALDGDWLEQANKPAKK